MLIKILNKIINLLYPLWLYKYFKNNILERSFSIFCQTNQVRVGKRNLILIRKTNHLFGLKTTPGDSNMNAWIDFVKKSWLVIRIFFSGCRACGCGYGCGCEPANSRRIQRKTGPRREAARRDKFRDGAIKINHPKSGLKWSCVCQEQ